VLREGRCRWRAGWGARFGAVTLVACVLGAALPAGAGASGVYVSSLNSSSMSVFSIGVGGALAPVACDPTTICKTGLAATASFKIIR
jgi:hypothetical protein